MLEYQTKTGQDLLGVDADRLCCESSWSSAGEQRVSTSRTREKQDGIPVGHVLVHATEVTWTGGENEHLPYFEFALAARRRRRFPCFNTFDGQALLVCTIHSVNDERYQTYVHYTVLFLTVHIGRSISLANMYARCKAGRWSTMVVDARHDAAACCILFRDLVKTLYMLLLFNIPVLVETNAILTGRIHRRRRRGDHQPKSWNAGT